MHHWDRNTAGLLERSSASQEKGCEVRIYSGQMEPPLEEQQSHQWAHRDPNVYRSMRDHIHPPRVSAPSCIVPPVEDMVVRPYLVPLLPTFHGMENENPYTHIREFEKVCSTFKEGVTNMDLMRLKVFPLTLKDKAKIWLNSLRPRSIRNWAELQAEFLKKFFITHKSNSLRGKFTPLQPTTMRNYISVGKGTWRPSLPVLTMALIHGCWLITSMVECPLL